MIGLFYKDLLVLRKQMRTYLLFILVYGVLVIKDVFPLSVLSGLVVLMGMMLPMTSFSYDDLARWDKYAASLPTGRRGIVAGKYLLSLFCTGISGLIVLVLLIALWAVGLSEENLMDLSLTVLASIGITLLINAVILPLLIKFGAEKSRIISTILFVAVFGGLMLTGTLLKQSNPSFILPAWITASFPVLLGVFCLGAFAVSYSISTGIMAHKEL